MKAVSLCDAPWWSLHLLWIKDKPKAFFSAFNEHGSVKPLFFLYPSPGFSQITQEYLSMWEDLFDFRICAHELKSEKLARKHTRFGDPFQTAVSAILTVKIVIFAVFLWGTFKDTYCTAGLGLALSVLDLGQNRHHLYQSPAQPRTRENDAANNIITALVHISLIWQKPSLSSVSHMVQCFIIGGMGSTKDQTL